MIKEDFLHYIWQSKKFELTELRSTNGQLIQILDFGYLNTDSGPDFFNAQIGYSLLGSSTLGNPFTHNCTYSVLFTDLW